MEMILYTHQVLKRVKGDNVRKTLAFAAKRICLIDHICITNYLKILCLSFGRESSQAGIFFKKKKKKSKKKLLPRATL